jgi:sporulation protein YlmC with PRC-barrel domain
VAETDLIRDVLDKQLVDPNGTKMGRVDGVVLVLRKTGPPRVAFIETGSATLARRIHPRLERWIVSFWRRVGLEPGPLRIPWSKVRAVGFDVTVNLDAGSVPLQRWQEWLNRVIIGRIPGG